MGARRAGHARHRDAAGALDRDAIQTLHAMGVRVAMLTGDAREVADAVEAGHIALGAVLMSASTVVVAVNAQLLKRTPL